MRAIVAGGFYRSRRFDQLLHRLDVDVLPQRKRWLVLACAAAVIEGFYLYSIMRIALGIFGYES